VCNDRITQHYTATVGDALTAVLRVTGRQFVLDGSETGRSSYSGIELGILVYDLRVTA
jgi:hypothetical protein